MIVRMGSSDGCKEQRVGGEVPATRYFATFDTSPVVIQ
jgi:hypothetical protein